MRHWLRLLCVLLAGCAARHPPTVESFAAQTGTGPIGPTGDIAMRVGAIQRLYYVAASIPPVTTARFDLGFNYDVVDVKLINPEGVWSICSAEGSVLGGTVLTHKDNWDWIQTTVVQITCPYAQGGTGAVFSIDVQGKQLGRSPTTYIGARLNDVPTSVILNGTGVVVNEQSNP